MPVTFLSVSSFRTNIENLCHKKRHGYRGCRQDVCQKLQTLTIEDIWEMNTRMREMGDVRMLKVRLPNAELNLSASDGYRLILCCNKTAECVVFLALYPKRGKLAQLDISPGEIKRLLRLLGTEQQNNTLVEHDIAQHLRH